MEVLAARNSGHFPSPRAQYPTRHVAPAGPILMVAEKRRSDGRAPAVVGGGRRAVPRIVQHRLERSAEYQVLLVHLLELSSRFQSTLSDDQRPMWLQLEDAFFDYAHLVSDFYYAEGRRPR